MTGADFEVLAGALRRRCPGLAVRLHREPPAAVRALPGWTPGTPWPRLVAAAPGLAGLSIRNDGRWAVVGESSAFRRCVETTPEGWAEATATAMLGAMLLHRATRQPTLLERLLRRRES